MNPVHRRFHLRAALLGACLLAGAGAFAQSITTVAGDGSFGSSGNGGPALKAGLGEISSITRDGNGNIYLVEADEYKIRKISPGGVITHFAGTGQPVFVTGTELNVGDGGPATAAAISPGSVAADAAGNVYFTDLSHHRVRKVSPAGIISTIAGRGEFGYTGDGGAATLARLGEMRGIAVDNGGNVYISVGQAIRKISSGGTITRVAGDLTAAGFGGDGGPATSALFNDPAGLALDAAGNLYVADSQNGRIRRVSNGGSISTVMGNPDGWPWDFYGRRVVLEFPRDVAVDSKGYVYTNGGPWIRKVSPEGLMANAGGFLCPNQACGISEVPAMIAEGGDLSQGYLLGQTSIEIEPDDSLLIATDHQRIRRISPSPPAQPPVAADVLKDYVAYPVAGLTNAVDIGDFDGDGRNDVVAATGESFGSPGADDFKVVLFRQQVDGSLLAAAKAAYSGPVSNWAPDIQLADFNHDGRKDIVVSRLQGFSVFLGNAGGVLSAQAIDVPKLQSSAYLLVTDIDGDGHLDIVSSARHADETYSGIWTVRGVGDGSFLPAQFVAYPLVFSNQTVGRLLPGDLDNDGDQDLLTTVAGSPQRTRMLRRDGPGLYGPGLTYESSGTTSLEVGDADDDGRDDILQFSYAGGGTLMLRRQDAFARFDAPRLFGVERVGERTFLRDMNKDGRKDLVQLSRGWALSYYQRNATGYERPRKYPLPFANAAGARSLAIGALDGDACDDVVVAGETHGVLVFRGQNCAAPSARRDLDADDRSELAWSKPDGSVEVWPGGEAALSVRMRPGAGWNLAAVADFSGRGKAQMLWRHCISGALMQSEGLVSPVAESTRQGPGREWQLAATGDFDGDGRADLLWLHASGATQRWLGGGLGPRQKGARLAPGWSVVATGDFDGDGRDDLFWRHGPTGANLVWRAGGLGGAWRIVAITDRDWKVVGSGDTDGDGRDDLVWRHSRSGRNVLWPGAEFAARRELTALPDPAWTVAAVDDVDGDRRADIRWRHASGAGLLWKRADPDLAVEAPPTAPGVLPFQQAPSGCMRGAPAARAPREDARRFGD